MRSALATRVLGSVRLQADGTARVFGSVRLQADGTARVFGSVRLQADPLGAWNAVRQRPHVIA
jgi:hypothetical protein